MIRRTWQVIGHHHDRSDERFCLTVQRDAVIKVIVVHLSTYAEVEAGRITEIALEPTREEIAYLEKRVAEQYTFGPWERARRGDLRAELVLRVIHGYRRMPPLVLDFDPFGIVGLVRADSSEIVLTPVADDYPEADILLT
jgi:hypothetical protein